MKFLIDTNIFLPLEITSIDDIEESTPSAMEFSRLSSQTKQQIYLHPIQLDDLKQDKNKNRRNLREILFNKYLALPSPPEISHLIEAVIGLAPEHTNSWIDNHLISAIYHNAADYLVTEDEGIIKKANRLNISDRVLTLIEARDVLKDLMDKNPAPPPAVEETYAHNINDTDPIFDSIRLDYPSFNTWLNKKCKPEHRTVWLINHRQSNCYGGICIIKPEDKVDFPVNYKKILKICCFKISEKCNGYKFGELLLKTVLKYSFTNRYQVLYVEIFEKYQKLIELFSDFGFEKIESMSAQGELRLVKYFTFKKDLEASLEPLEFNKRFGPFIVRTLGVPAYLVPIRPEYHKLLFPEWEDQQILFPGEHPYGNSIRKAYLCNSQIRTIKSGENLFFYRSQDAKKITALGIVEKVLIANNADTIASFVGRRTVYTYEEIRLMCKKNSVLAILFRQVKLFKPAISIQDKIATPQQIASITQEDSEWLYQI